MMSIYAIYRVCIWLPIVVPATLILIANLLGLRLASGVVVEAIAYSLIWGGLPYAALAAWATWWVSAQPEAKIRRLMFRTPLLMVAIFVPLALAVGLTLSLGYGLDAFRAWAVVALLGGVLILILGYAYVGLTILLRYSFGPGPTTA